jgi:hypothetical protein
MLHVEAGDDVLGDLRDRYVLNTVPGLECDGGVRVMYGE